MSEEIEETTEVAEEVPAADAAEDHGVSEPTPGDSQPAVPAEKKKRKHLPRAERPKKGRRVRTPSADRKAIVRLPKPEHERGRTQERRGVVVSSAMDKTIVVKVDVIKSHPRYKKVVRRSVKFHAHDEQNAANVGDIVRIVETRPLSATKRWRLAEIVEAAK
jgi:small subunit ribosomal protein S17